MSARVGSAYNKDTCAEGGDGSTPFVYYGYISKLRQTLAPQKRI